MPRLSLLPPPDAATLRALPLHVIVRDWPETLGVLRARGVDVAREGGPTLDEARPADAAVLAAALVEATTWRRPG